MKSEINLLLKMDKKNNLKISDLYERMFKIIARSETIIIGCTFLQKIRIEILYYAKKV